VIHTAIFSDLRFFGRILLGVNSNIGEANNNPGNYDKGKRSGNKLLG
jgi:hypothetical protein